MKYKAPRHGDRHDVEPGGRFATSQPTIIATILGSCVAACIYDQERKVAGMNHFLLAAPRYARAMPMTQTDAGRYGIHAMELLLNDMFALGARRGKLRAKVFGGASVINSSQDNFLCVHEVNQRFIREYLAAEAIPIVSEDLGGERGRVIFFNTDTFAVMRRYVIGRRLIEVENEEKSYWKPRAERPETQEGTITLFD
ncbi:MAG: chemotaxis protein CheD [Spirochaetaceae bacterium]|nr:chemotaxis protein CheD [Spirochaetaceae bacterium]